MTRIIGAFIVFLIANFNIVLLALQAKNIFRFISTSNNIRNGVFLRQAYNFDPPNSPKMSALKQYQSVVKAMLLATSAFPYSNAARASVEIAKSCSTIPGFSASPALKGATVIKKRSGDLRDYRAITLSNGIRTLLISDPSTTRSAAAIDVHVGSMMDPVDIPGLAHFCEHMSFLGTEKYPGEVAIIWIA